MQPTKVRVKSKKIFLLIYLFILCRTLNWKNAVDETERFLDGTNLPCILIENKSDLLDQNKINDLTELRKFASDNKFITCFRTSAKTGYNINESMSYLIENVLERMSKINSKEYANARKTITLDPEKHENDDSIRQQQKSGCC